jgi:hypothetical protein
VIGQGVIGQGVIGAGQTRPGAPHKPAIGAAKAARCNVWA